jgi:hypothetical protein
VGDLVAALERLERDEGLRRALIERSIAHVRDETMDAQLERIYEFLTANVAVSREHGRRAI